MKVAVGAGGRASAAPPLVAVHAAPPFAISAAQSSTESTSALEIERTFLMFTRVLMQYLEQKDPPQHQKVQAIIKDCAERNRYQECGYDSVTASRVSMKARSRKLWMKSIGRKPKCIRIISCNWTMPKQEGRRRIRYPKSIFRPRRTRYITRRTRYISIASRKNAAVAVVAGTGLPCRRCHSST